MYMNPRKELTCFLKRIESLLYCVFVDGKSTNTTLIKKFWKFTLKIQNTSTFIKIDIVLFKLLPIDCTYASAWSNSWNLSGTGFWYGHQRRPRFFHYFLLVTKTPFLVKKSQETIPREFDGCRIVFDSFLVNNSRIMMAQ